MCLQWASLASQTVTNNPPAVQETQVPSLGWEDLLEKGIATHYPPQYFCLEKLSLWREVFSRHTRFYVKIIYFENRFYVANHLKGQINWGAVLDGGSGVKNLRRTEDTQEM